MKIEITDELIAGMATQIRKDALARITSTVRQLEDEELLSEIRASSVTNKDKVLAYLKRTNLNGGQEEPRFVQVSSEYVRKGLGLHPHEMKPIRDEMEGEHTIWTRKESRGGLHIYFRAT